MKEIVGDFWDHADDYDAIVVTTNCILDRNGHLVMGGGIARDFAERFNLLPLFYGTVIRKYGAEKYLNKPFVITATDPDEPYQIALPTKYHWKDPSPIELIVRSCKQLDFLSRSIDFDNVLMTRPGCGLGGQNWDVVKEKISFLDDRFTVINNE